MTQIIKQLAQELDIKQHYVEKTVALLDDGATVPFIARYRKELTGSMADDTLRVLASRLKYFRELYARQGIILESITEQGKLTADLKSKIMKTLSKVELEDLYLPYKTKRRTKAQIAIEKGLEPLALILFEDVRVNPEDEAKKYLDDKLGLTTTKCALDGARDILVERIAEDAQLIQILRKEIYEQGHFSVSVLQNSDEQKTNKYRDYFEFNEKIKTIPSHRMLAILRGRREGVLKITICTGDEESFGLVGVGLIKRHLGYRPQQLCGEKWFESMLSWCWNVKLSYKIETDIIVEKRISAEKEAINVFASNVKDLLMAPPASSKITMGLDPGFRSGVKVAIVDAVGQVIQHSVIYPHKPQAQWEQAKKHINDLIQEHQVELISIGNGTASRETDALVRECFKSYGVKKTQSVVVSEAGASVYSASEYASQELPELDVTIRGAVSIARRLQDPLAELVKIDPKSIGVGQYQHDVNQRQLAQRLDEVIEDCVNTVGVDINLASEPLLTNVSGLNAGVAKNIVAYRNTQGRFEDRHALLKVTGIGAKVYEQAAGFLRVIGGNQLLDESAVHPESYHVVETMMSKSGLKISEAVGKIEQIKKIDPSHFVNESIGLETLKDILMELEKPGRDPRPSFEMMSFKEGVTSLSDLKKDMILKGVVTNVVNFGAFVDIGVHQDALVHISMLSDQYVKDPRDVVKTGDIVSVKVIDVDSERKRISLTMKLNEQTSEQKNKKHKTTKQTVRNQKKPTQQVDTALQRAFKNAGSTL
jgi:protein Tex